MKILNANPALIPVKSISSKQTFKEGTEKEKRVGLRGKGQKAGTGEMRLSLVVMCSLP